MAKRKTHEEFVNEMKEVNPNIEILGEYVNSKEKILCKCKIDNNEWCATPTNLLRGRGCPVCGRKLVNKNRKKTHDDFVNEMSNKNPNIDILGRYINAKTKILCKCKIDGYEWETSPSHLSAGSGCPKCGRNVRTRTTEQFIDEMKIVNPNLQILGEFTKADNKILTKCLVCEHEWTPKAIQLLDGHGCPICAKISRRRTHESFIEEVNKISPDIKIKGKYITSDKKIDCECKYGHKWSTKPNNLLMGHGCPICRDIQSRKNQALTQEEFEEYVYRINPYIKVDGEYINRTTRVECHCTLCNHSFTIKPKGARLFCPVCGDGVSYPNKFLRSLLEQLNVEDLQFEYSPEWANRYRYDSYFIYKKKQYIVEMDGGFHYDQNFGEQTPEKVVERDKIKEKLAKEHNIKLIRIDCQKSDKDYISKNILNSVLSKMFDLSNIDWNECHVNSLKSMVKQACDLYEEGYSSTKIAKKLNCSAGTIMRYLKMGAEISWCNYPKPKKKFSVYDKQNLLIGTFDSIQKCIDYMNNNYEDNFYRTQIYTNCNGKRKSYKGFVFKYVA